MPSVALDRKIKLRRRFSDQSSDGPQNPGLPETNGRHDKKLNTRPAGLQRLKQHFTVSSVAQQSAVWCRNCNTPETALTFHKIDSASFGKPLI
jgi:hypothetical protein